MSLLWRVFLANVLVLLVALALLTFSPIEVSYPIKFWQFLLLFVGFVVLVDDEPRPDAARARAAPAAHRGDGVDRPRQARHPARGGGPSERRRARPRARLQRHARPARDAPAARRPARRSTAQEAERLRVAQELHDEIGQTLTAVTIQAERAAEGDPADARQALRDVANAVRDSLDEVRRIARELRPEALDDLGLVNALIALCNAARRARTGRASSATSQGTLPPLPPEVELVHLPGRPGEPHERRPPRRARARSACGSRATRSRSRCACATTGEGMPSELPAGTSGHRRHARAGDARWRALLDRVDPQARAPRCGSGSRWTRTGDDRPAEDPHPARRRPRRSCARACGWCSTRRRTSRWWPRRRRRRGGRARALGRRRSRGAGRDDAAHDRPAGGAGALAAASPSCGC